MTNKHLPERIVVPVLVLQCRMFILSLFMGLLSLVLTVDVRSVFGSDPEALILRHVIYDLRNISHTALPQGELERYGPRFSLLRSQD
jgi:hypothetical protein